MSEAVNESKVFKVGNSYGLRLTKKDKEKLHLQVGDELEKKISPDGRQITFKKKQAIDPKTQKQINQIFDEDSDLLDALKDL